MEDLEICSLINPAHMVCMVRMVLIFKGEQLTASRAERLGENLLGLLPHNLRDRRRHVPADPQLNQVQFMTEHSSN